MKSMINAPQPRTMFDYQQQQHQLNSIASQQVTISNSQQIQDWQNRQAVCNSVTFNAAKLS